MNALYEHTSTSNGNVLLLRNEETMATTARIVRSQFPLYLFCNNLDRVAKNAQSNKT